MKSLTPSPLLSSPQTECAEPARPRDGQGGGASGLSDQPRGGQWKTPGELYRRGADDGGRHGSGETTPTHTAYCNSVCIVSCFPVSWNMGTGIRLGKGKERERREMKQVEQPLPKRLY